MGPWTSLHSLSRTRFGMMPGDTVRMSVYAKYDQPTKTREAISGMAGIIAGAITGGAGNVEGIQQISRSIGETLKGGQAALLAKNNDIPKAYLNYIFFDKEMQSKSTNFTQVTEAAHGSFEHLEMEFIAKEEGYLMTYTANETNEDLSVFMDDMTVTHTTGPIVRVDDYYPFGLTFNTSELDGKLTNKYLYQGKELQPETETYDFHARGYDPILGRTWQIDPISEKYYGLSPYSWVANNPLIFTDPTGMEIDWSEISGREKRIAKRALRKHKSSGTYKNLYKQLKKSENRYVIKASYNEKTTVGATFEGNFSTTLEGPDGNKVVLQNPGTEGDFASDEKGGIITLNFSMVDGLKNKEQASALGDFAVEEVVHAAQYDDLNQDRANGLPVTANTEFEAKTIVGQIQFESEKSLLTSTDDRSANSFGINAFKTNSTVGYQNALKEWHDGLRPSSAYKGLRITKAAPTLLIRLVNNRIR